MGTNDGYDYGGSGNYHGGYDHTPVLGPIGYIIGGAAAVVVGLVGLGALAEKIFNEHLGANIEGLGAMVVVLGVVSLPASLGLAAAVSDKIDSYRSNKRANQKR